MKRLLLFIATICILGPFSNFHLFGQEYLVVKVDLPLELKAHAGIDQTIDKGNSTILGDTQVASGGTEDYIYVWTPSADLDNPYAEHPVATPDKTTTYTLLVLDGNGCTASDDIVVFVGSTGLNDSEKKEEYLVYPNPTSNKFFIQRTTPSTSPILNVEVVDVMGKVVYLKEFAIASIKSSVEIDISQFPVGIYFIRISDFSSQSLFKLVKN